MLSSVHNEKYIDISFFRQGAPFYKGFKWLLQNLEDGGIIEHWTQDVIAKRVRENRKETFDTNTIKEIEAQVY